MPNNVDLGASHIAFFVDDIRAAAQSLKEHGAELLRGPIQAQGDIKKGEEVWYFKTPWGAFMEILWRPYRLGYEKDTANRIFQPHDNWLDRALGSKTKRQPEYLYRQRSAAETIVRRHLDL